MVRFYDFVFKNKKISKKNKTIKKNKKATAVLNILQPQPQLKICK